MDGAWITGPASNPLSFLNGPAYRSFGSLEPYDFPDFRPAADLDRKLPGGLSFEVEERFRSEGYSNAALQAGNSDSYVLNEFRIQADLRSGSWWRMSAQAQDSRPFFQKPPIGPPNENRWDLKLAYAEIGDPSRHWFSLRVGRQLINYNNTLMANSEWRNQGRSYDAAVLNLQGHGYHLGIFAASIVKPLASGISYHQQGNNIYGIYASMKGPLAHMSIEPFVLWRVQPSVTIAPTVSSATGKQDMRAWGVRWKGVTSSGFDYSAEAVLENGAVGPAPIHAWATTEGIAYQFGGTRGHPRVFAQYDFASGAGTGSTTHSRFDTIYPTAHDRFGILDLFGWQNIEAVRTGATVEPPAAGTWAKRWTSTPGTSSTGTSISARVLAGLEEAMPCPGRAAATPLQVPTSC